MVISTPFTFLEATNWKDYALLDSGDGLKLERFGKYVFARPESQAMWKRTLTSEWKNADAVFQPTGEESGGHWDFKKKVDGKWVTETVPGTATKVLDPQYIDKRELTGIDISGYKIKGYWYFDKRQGELKYRLLGVAPVAPDVNFIDNAGAEDEVVELFWVWYPGARETTFDMKVFNQRNSAYPLSFDHLLNARRFNSIIYREENIYGNRDVAEYIKGNSLFQVLESESLKESIRDKELDMWNY